MSSNFQSFSAPRFANVCSGTRVPWSRRTSSRVYGRSTPDQRFIGALPRRERFCCRDDSPSVSLLFHFLFEVVIRGQRQELCEIIVSRDSVEELPRSSKFIRARVFHLGDFFIQYPSKHFARYLTAIIEHAALIANPLPDLCPRDLCSRGIFH